MLDYYKEVLEQQNEPPANYEADIEARKEEVIKELKEKKEPMQVNYKDSWLLQVFNQYFM